MNKFGNKFPSNFDFNFFFNGIDILIDYEHSVSTPKTLWLIYKTFHIFPLQEQLVIAEKLLKTKAGILFYTWSWNTRFVFNKIFFYQLYKVFIKDDDQSSNEESKKDADFFNKQKGMDNPRRNTEGSLSQFHSKQEAPTDDGELGLPQGIPWNNLALLEFNEVNKNSESGKFTLCLPSSADQ